MHYGDIKRALASGDRAGLFAAARDERRWDDIRTSPYYRPMIEGIRAEGKRLLSEPIETLPYSVYKLFDTTGSRIEYERLYFARRKRLAIVAFLELLDGEALYLEAAEDAMWAICDEFAWSLPAHLGGASLDSAAERRHRYAIDLFAAETAFALSEICSLLEGRLSAVVAERAMREVRERVLEPYASLGSSYGWETADNNWAAVCAGSVGAAALYALRDAEELAPVVHRLLGTLECYLDGFGEDGACTEGVGYWTYGFGFYMYFAELLKERTAGAIDLLARDRAEAIAKFHQACYLTGPYTVPFSDCETTSRHSPGIVHALKRRFPDVHVPEAAHRLSILEDPIGRWAPFIRDFVWSEPAWTGESWPDDSYVLPDAQWFVTRWTARGERMAFAAKGGHNGEPHNHNDLGSFVLHIGGETLLCDLGSGEYTKGYFGAERYSYLCNGSQGHSVPIVEGCLQGTGAAFRARTVRVDREADAHVFAVDLTNAYDVTNLASLVREFVVHRGEAALEVADRYDFRAEPAGVTGRFVTLREPSLLPDGVIRIAGDNHAVRMSFDDAIWRPVVRRFEFVDKSSREVAVYAVDLELRETAGVVGCEMKVRFEYDPVTAGTFEF